MSRPVWDDGVSWQEQALCRGSDPNLFFTADESKEDREVRERKAKAICARCPVMQQCRTFSMATREPFGIWGGLNEIERRHILERRTG